MRSDGSRDELHRLSDLEAEYEILRELGRGGTAVVYLARDRALGREVAIKVIRATYVEDEAAAARLTREARTVAQLQHPGIVMLYGTRRLADGSLALIMQYVRGRTLKEEVRETGPLPVDRVRQILLDLAQALACAQRHRIVHRDIKPENIYLNEGTGGAQLSDFGIARPWDSDCSLTLPGMAIGTPAYMAPEQIDGSTVDGRSDIYSLGLVAYEMLTGRAPWAGETIYSTIYKQKNEDLPPLEKLRPDAPVELRRVIEQALQKDPADRWASADALIEALTEGTSRTARRRGKGKAARRRQRRKAATEGASVSAAAPKARWDENATILYRRDTADLTPVVVQPVSAAPLSGNGARRNNGSHVNGRNADAKPAPSAPVPALAAASPAEEGSSLALAHLEPMRAAVVAVLLAVFVIGTPVLMAAGPRVNGTGTPAGPGAGMPQVAAAAPAAAETTVTSTAAEPVVGTGAAVLAYPLYGDIQDGVAGDTLATPLVLRVEDAAGRPVGGVEVVFTPVEGAGRLFPDRGTTDEHGLVRARWVPETAGMHRVEARASGVEDVAEFHARVGSRDAARLVDARGRDAAGAGGSRLVVRVEDERGQPVEGAEVRFAVTAGGGRVEPVTAHTDRDGVARAQWVFGRGAQQAEARVPGRDEAGVVVFSETADAPRVAIRGGVVAGGTHTCALTGDGVASCWGGNESGQLGDGAAGRRGGASRVAAPEPFARLAAGVSHTCAVGVSGSAFCWGSNGSGQLGDGTRVGRAQPARVQAGVAFTTVVAGMGHSCGLDVDGRLHCWGENAHGQLGDGSRSTRESAVRVAGGTAFRTVAAGWAHTCALARDGRAWCWGRNSSGELGDGSTTDRTRPVAVAGGHRFTDIAAGSAHSCGLRTDGIILCWGENSHGQLGSGQTAASPRPVQVTAAEPFSALTVGGVHSCGLARSGAVFCWGRNTYGQLGDGSTQNRAQPARVGAEVRFTSVRASGAHTCGRGADGADYCWGYNIEGQLGDGTRTNQTRPVRVTQRR